MEYRGKNFNVEVFNVLKSIADSLGIKIVDVNYQKKGVSSAFLITIFKDSGVTTDDCANFYSAIISKLEIMFDNSVELEITSPGINRVLKSSSEFEIFVGKNVAILQEDASEWINGAILGADEDSVILNIDNIETKFFLNNIKKAKLI